MKNLIIGILNKLRLISFINVNGFATVNEKRLLYQLQVDRV